ncbi:hypothetical protein GUJ93_ZPchr0005g16321 [Zizania palustris]|uniref:Uncharacterized protein n=1 Tax=Zizania palustris TaxID=103762 RepID=A0A8J5W139_ZIZPA|nr:hypothetical protein GUJ93_ZPchr0005g16321 [Zizania palustris]
MKASVPWVKDSATARHFSAGTSVGPTYGHRSNQRVPMADDKHAGNVLTGQHITLCEKRSYLFKFVSCSKLGEACFDGRSLLRRSVTKPTEVGYKIDGHQFCAETDKASTDFAPGVICMSNLMLTDQVKPRPELDHQKLKTLVLAYITLS